MVGDQTGQSDLIKEFVRNKAVSRQYHTYFNWGDNHANHFFGLFGKDFSAAMKMKVRESNDLQEAIKEFMYIGSKRNGIAHLDYASFSLDKTPEEIYASYSKGLYFVKQLPDFFGACSQHT